MKILIYFILCSINVVAYNEIRPSPFKVLFKTDAISRMINGRSYEIKSSENGMSTLTHITKPEPTIPSNPLNDAYVQLCDNFDDIDLRTKFFQEQMQDMQVEFIENGKLKKRRIIIGTSLEFEIAVFSFCALSYKKMEKWKHCSAPIDGGYIFDMGIEMSKKDGHLNIIWNTKIMKREKGKPKTDPAFQKFVDQLWEKDVDRIDESDIHLDWQRKLGKNEIKDISRHR
uniref:Uncharacterized protein n=1 Tax=Meloidogyne floridensis TaxID=298350 RepID=A0A915PDA2_9BILA